MYQCGTFPLTDVFTLFMIRTSTRLLNWRFQGKGTHRVGTENTKICMRASFQWAEPWWQFLANDDDTWRWLAVAWNKSTLSCSYFLQFCEQTPYKFYTAIAYTLMSLYKDTTIFFFFERQTNIWVKTKRYMINHTNQAEKHGKILM